MTYNPLKTHKIYYFGDFRLDADNCELRRGKDLEPVEPKPLQVLSVLIEKRGGFVRIEELLSAAWNVNVEKGIVPVTINKLRRALKDDTEPHKYIKSDKKLGYKFIATVKVTDSRGFFFSKGFRIFAGAVISLLVILGSILMFSSREKYREPRAEIRSVAILPFQPLNPDQGNSGLEIIMTDAVITRLQNIQGITVRPYSAVKEYLTTSKEPIEIGRDLSVDSVLSGHIRQAGDKLEIKVSLRRVSDNAVLKQIDKTGSRSEIEKSVSGLIARELKPAISAEEINRVMRTDTDNPKAQELYDKGRQEWAKRTRDGITESIKFFKEAISQDETFARAYVGVADATLVSCIFGSAFRSPTTAMPEVKWYLSKALELKPDLGEAHISLASYYLLFEYNWELAENEFQLGIKLNHNYQTGHHWYAQYLLSIGKGNEALNELQEAQDIDLKKNPLISATRVWMLYLIGRNSDAVDLGRFYAEGELKEFPPAHAFLGLAYEKDRRYEEALAEFEKARSPQWSDFAPMGLKAHVYGVSGKTADARKILNDLLNMQKTVYVSPYVIATVYIGLGEKDNAILWLNKAKSEQSCWLVQLKIDPHFDPIRSDPGFVKLIDEMKFPL